MVEAQLVVGDAQRLSATCEYSLYFDDSKIAIYFYMENTCNVHIMLFPNVLLFSFKNSPDFSRQNDLKRMNHWACNDSNDKELEAMCRHLKFGKLH